MFMVIHSINTSIPLGEHRYCARYLF